MSCWPKWKVGLAMAGIFAAGSIAGGFGAVAWYNKNSPSRAPSPDQYTDRYLERMIAEVKLTQEQVECFRPLMSEFSEKLSVMRRQAGADAVKAMCSMDHRLEADLSPEQRELYRAMRKADRERWEKRFGPEIAQTGIAPVTPAAAPDDKQEPH